MNASETSFITQLVQFDFSTISAGKRFWPSHLHHYFQLDVILTGTVDVSIEGYKPIHAKRRDTWLIPPLLKHAYKSQTYWRQASFKFHLAPRYWQWFGKNFYRFRLSTALQHVIGNFGNRYQTKSPLADHETKAVLILCLAELLVTRGRKIKARPLSESFDSFRPKLWLLLEKVESRPDTSWTVDSLAAMCHLSRDHFSRCFHQCIGKTPRRYLLETRIRTAAAALLEKPSLPIKEIAERAGYATVHAFTRAFTQLFRVGPATYRHSPPMF